MKKNYKRFLTGLGVTCIMAGPVSAQDLKFKEKVDYAVPINATGLVDGDFNEDGKLDFVSSNGTSYNGGGLAVNLGNGDGTFQVATTIESSITPFSLEAADFNNDGHLDILSTVNANYHTCLLFYGNGDGTFQSEVQVPGMRYSEAIRVTDLNNDGKLDYVTSGNSIVINAIQDDVSFSRYAKNFSDPGNASGDVLAIDVNEDGYKDMLAVSPNANAIWIYINNGDGLFTNVTPTSITTGTKPNGATSGYFNNDNHVDMAVTNNDATVSVFLGNGDGTFSDKVDYPTATTARKVYNTDMNNDGISDLLVTSDDTFSFLSGKGDGTFNEKQEITIPNTVIKSTRILDLNGDGLKDIAFAEYGEGSVSVLFQTTISITANPVSKTICQGAATMFSVEASSTLPLSYNWQIKTTEGFEDISDNSTFSGAQTNELSITPDPSLDGTTFRCIVNDTKSEDTTSEAELTVHSNIEVVKHTYIVSENEQEVVLTADITGSAKSYTWKKDGFEVVEDEYLSGVNTNTLTISMTSNNYYGSYSLLVTGECNEEETTSAEVGAITSVFDGQNSFGVEIYPNPAENFITVKGGVEQLQVVNLSGKVVLEQSHVSDNSAVNVSSLEKGIYGVRLKNGQNIQVQKLIIR